MTPGRPTQTSSQCRRAFARPVRRCDVTAAAAALWSLLPGAVHLGGYCPLILATGCSPTSANAVKGMPVVLALLAGSHDSSTLSLTREEDIASATRQW
jgi:hypothetical protein